MTLRTVLVAVLLAGGLGCSGLGQKVMDLTGSEVRVGPDAVHPADFPLPPPPGGTLTASATMNAMGMKNTTLQYDLPSDAGVLDLYETVMKDAGLGPTRSSQMGNDTVTAAAGGGTWTAMVVNQGEKTTLSLSVVQGGAQEPGAPSAEGER